MVDIILGDRPKKILLWMRKRIISGYDVSFSPEPDIRYVYDKTQFVVSKLTHRHHEVTLDILSKIGVWAISTKNIGNSFAHDALYALGNGTLRSMITEEQRKPVKLSWVDSQLQKIVLYGCRRFYDDYRCNPVDIRNDLVNSGNEAIRYLYKVFDEKIREHDMEDFREYIELFLWIAYKDSGWRDQFFWLMNEIGSDHVKSLVSEYVFDPVDWSVNVWQRSKDRTKKERADGVIPDGVISYPERVNVMPFQKAQLEKIVGQKIYR